MDPEEERVLYLTRVGKETIIKWGTYDVKNVRPITQDHPFYEYKSIAEGEAYLRKHASGEDKIDQNSKDSLGEIDTTLMPADDNSDAFDEAQKSSAGSLGGTSGAAAAASAENDNPDALADEILSSNFKVGMSQSEVDDFLKELLANQ